MKTKKPASAKKPTTVRVHVEYGENDEHTTYTIKVPSGLSRDVYVIAKGMLFASSWVLDDHSNGHNWSVWVNGVCVESHGEHTEFHVQGTAESKVTWLFGEARECYDKKSPA